MGGQRKRRRQLLLFLRPNRTRGDDSAARRPFRRTAGDGHVCHRALPNVDKRQPRAHCLFTFARSRVRTKKVNTADRSLTHWHRHEIRRVTTEAAADPRDEVSEQRRSKHNWGTTTTCSFRSFALPPPRRVEEKERTRARATPAASSRRSSRARSSRRPTTRAVVRHDAATPGNTAASGRPRSGREGRRCRR